MVATYWDPAKTSSFSSKLTSFQCFSSWHHRNDKSGNADITGWYQGAPNRLLANVIDGYTCKHSSGFDYYSDIGLGWLQIDLKGIYTLKCVRVPVRSEQVFFTTYFKGIEFRFGNESRNGNYKLNPIIGLSEDESFEQIVEFCPNYQLVGRYMIMQKVFSDKLIIPEVQITVQ